MIRDMGGDGRKKRGMSAEDAALWQAVTRDIKPLFADGKPQAAPTAKAKPPEKPKTSNAKPDPSGKPQPPPLTPRRRSEEPKVPAPASLDRRTHKKVARGHVGIDSRIDLHGMRQEEAHRLLRTFLRQAQARGDRVVLVITGKGKERGGDAAWWEARETGILKRVVPRWLHEADLRSIVVGFDWASQAHGGEGALYVRLRKRR